MLAKLTQRLATSSSDLRSAKQSLEVSDAELMARTEDLKTAEDAKRVSDDDLMSGNKQLAEAVKELAKANENLKLQDKMQREFINIAAHELRTPIQPIIGIIDMLEFSFDKDKYSITKDDIEIITRNATRLKRLAEDILDVARIEGDNFKMQKNPLDLAELVANTVKDNQVAAKKSNTELIYRHGKEIIVSADKDRIIQVLSNLLDNAIKFSPDGTITVTVDKDDRQGIVEVSDTGGNIQRSAT